VKITWWGHSTATIEDSSVRILTDPLLVDRLGHLRRRRGPIPPRAARSADAVVISHLHADHLHVPSLRLLPASVRILAPRGTRALLGAFRGDLGERCEEVVPGDEVQVGAVRVQAVPAAHDGRRHPLSRRTGPPLGFLISGRGRAYFAGDTDLIEEMHDLRPVDVALLPVGGWGPTLGRGHLDPTRAVEAARRCAPRVVVPIHWGTMWPVGLGRVRPDRFFGPGEEFARAMRAALPDVDVPVLKPGGTAELAAAGS
jgi:L-ascorbate metabolism protein UlaG (beta-lactamase superfamily)